MLLYIWIKFFNFWKIFDDTISIYIMITNAGIKYPYTEILTFMH